MKKHYITLVALFLSALAYSGCHTMEGAGRDLERGGEQIQRNAEKHS